MKPLNLLFSAGVLLLMFASCKKDEEKNNDCVIDSPWYKDGLRLAYKNNSAYIDADSLIVTMKKITDTRFESRSDVGAIGFGGFQEICGGKLYSASKADYSDKYLLYDLDASVGQSWTTTASTTLGNSVKHTMTLTEKGKSVIVPAGTYVVSVIRMVSEMADVVVQSTNMYVAEGHGMIKVLGTTTDYELGSVK